MKIKSSQKAKRSLKQRREDEVLNMVRESKSRPARRVGSRYSTDGPSIKAVHVSPKTRKKTKDRPSAAQAGDPVRYDTNKEFDSGLHYQVTDPPPPIVPGKAKPNLGLNKRTDANVVGFGHSHDEAVDGNAYFVTPQPTKLVFDAKLGELEAILSELDNHRIAGKALTDQRDIVRGEFELLFTQRGDYVTLMSQGDAAVIMSAGIPVRNGPTPVGILPSPLALRVDLNGEKSVMVIRWDPVTGAKSYMLEYAEVTNNVAGEWSLLYMGGKYSTRRSGMVVGKTYAFRVATVGGEGGKSAFSPEVWRAAA